MKFFPPPVIALLAVVAWVLFMPDTASALPRIGAIFTRPFHD